MGLFDFITELLGFSLQPNTNGDKKQPKIYILFAILIIPGVFWFVIELRPIFESGYPILFLLISTVVGLVLSAGAISLIYRLGLIEELNTKDVLTVLIPVTLLTISLASFLVRVSFSGTSLIEYKPEVNR
jgi:hypothetical protein